MTWNLLEAAAQARQSQGQDRSTGPAVGRYPLAISQAGYQWSFLRPNASYNPYSATYCHYHQNCRICSRWRGGSNGLIPCDDSSRTGSRNPLELFITSSSLKTTAGHFKLRSAASIPLCRVCGSAESPGWQCNTWQASESLTFSECLYLRLPPLSSGHSGWQLNVDLTRVWVEPSWPITVLGSSQHFLDSGRFERYFGMSEPFGSVICSIWSRDFWMLRESARLSGLPLRFQTGGGGYADCPWRSRSMSELR